MGPRPAARLGRLRARRRGDRRRSSDGTLELIEVASGRRQAFHAEDGLGDRVVFSPDGAWIATTDGHESVRLWERATGASRRLAGEHAGGSNLRFSDDGALILVRHPGGGARMWHAPSGEPAALPGGDDRLAAFVTGGRDLAIAVGAELSLVDRDDGRVLARTRLDGPPFDVWASADGRTIGAARIDALALWTPGTGALRRVAGGNAAVALLTPSPDGRRFMSCGRGATDLWLFDIAAGSGRAFAGDEACRRQASAFSPDGNVYLSAGYGGEIRLHEVSDRRTRRLVGHEAAVVDAAFSPDGRLLASVSSDHTVRIWALGAGDVRVEHDVLVMDLVAAGGRALVASASTGALSVLDVSAGTATALTGPRRAPFGNQGTLSPDGRVAAFPDADGAWRVADLGGGGSRPLVGAAGLAEPNEVDELAPDGGTLAQADGTGAVWLVDVAAGRRRELGRLGDVALAIAFSRDGASLAAGGRDGLALVWSVKDGAERGRLRCQGYVWSLAFAAAGDRLAAACTDGIARILDLSGGSVTELRGHVGGVTGVGFAPDGRHFLSSGADGTVRLWDLATQTGLIVRRAAGPTQASFSNDGSLVAMQSGRELRILDARVLPPLEPDAKRLTDWIGAMTSATVDAAGHLATP